MDLDNLMLEVYNHENDETVYLRLMEFVDWFNVNDDIFSIGKVWEDKNG